MKSTQSGVWFISQDNQEVTRPKPWGIWKALLTNKLTNFKGSTSRERAVAPADNMQNWGSILGEKASTPEFQNEQSNASQNDTKDA